MIHVLFIDSINKVDASKWNTVAGVDYPFTRHEFLKALEDSQATHPNTGWQAQHALLYRDNVLIAILPLYIKHHSYGEYVFDHAWANAYQQHGLDYYPKLLSAIPFTPATGQRLCYLADEDPQEICQFIFKAVEKHAKELSISSWHLLFPQQEISQLFNTIGAKQRIGVQFHWQNQNYQSFDDFLSTFSSRKRKNLKKERRRISEQGIDIEVYEGANIPPSLWETFYQFYQMTYSKLSGHGGYLTQSFFEKIAESMPEHLVLVIARHQDQTIAAALNFRDSNTLYGRYWGCSKELDQLHFEACYYQGIEYCIKHNIAKFDPGAQGEHKIQRGFNPVYTYSNHLILDSRFKTAIDDFLQQEKPHIKRYHQQAQQYLPFKKATD